MAMLQRASELASKGNLQASFDKHVASPTAKMSFVKHEKLLEEAATKEAAAQKEERRSDCRAAAQKAAEKARLAIP